MRSSSKLLHEPWPADPDEMAALQEELGRVVPDPWSFKPGARVGACFVAYAKGKTGAGSPGEPAWAAAVTFSGRREVAVSCCRGEAAGAYRPGMLAAREGALLQLVVQGLEQSPDVLIVDATGRDHPRGAGLALHLGAVLDLPTVGVTQRTLIAEGDAPGEERWSSSALAVQGGVVGFWVRSRTGARPVAVHAGWRTSPEEAAGVLRASCRRARTPEPLRRARKLARLARAGLVPAEPCNSAT